MYEEFQDVGLMTGDVTINPSASVIIMTTEVFMLLHVIGYTFFCHWCMIISDINTKAVV